MLAVQLAIFGSHMRVQEICRELLVNGWKLLATVIKSSCLDIGRVSGSTRGRKWNTGYDLKAEVYHALHNLFKEGGAAPTLKKVSTD